MNDSCSVGFKEWSVICAALAAGRQSLILRKGGIHEGREGFRVAHERFWLFPTHYHEAAQNITAEGMGFLAEAVKYEAPAGQIRFELLAVVEQVFNINDEATLGRLAGLHIWSQPTVLQRFHYRQPGLFALLVRIHRTMPMDIADDSHFAGCKSWVEFRDALPTASARPVLSDSVFAEQRRNLAAAITPF